jgi:hypothetical protein
MKAGTAHGMHLKIMEFPKQRVRIATLQECEQVSVCEEV